MRLIIHSNQYCRRGDAVNARAFSVGLKKYHGVESLLVANATNRNNDQQVIDALRADGLALELYSNQRELQKIADRFRATHSYFMKNGKYDGSHIKGIPNVVHAVFKHFEPHGDQYIYVSKWLHDCARAEHTTARWFLNYPRWTKVKLLSGNPYFPSETTPVGWCPHIVSLSEPDSRYKVRERFRIPKDYPIIGRFGGRQEFNDPAGRGAILELLRIRKDVFFLFYNTDPFINHDRVMFVDEYISEAEKSSVINECTLMLNCRLAGESFGFSICEALFLGKPIIAPSLVRNPQMDAHHIEVLNDPELLYDSSEDLVTKIQKILENPRDSETYKRKVQQFSPKKISDALFSILSFI